MLSNRLYLQYCYATYLTCYFISADFTTKIFLASNKVGRVFPIVIRPEFLMRQYKDNDHREEIFYRHYFGKIYSHFRIELSQKLCPITYGLYVVTDML